MDNKKKREIANHPLDVPTQEELVKYIDEFLEETGIKASTFGREVMGDSGFIPRLRDGNDLRLSTLRKIHVAIEKIRKDQILQKMLQEMME